MSDSKDFTKEETSASASESARVLWRLVMSLKLLRVMFLPTIVLIGFAALFPQLALWLMSEFGKCGHRSVDCPVAIESLGIEFNVGLTLILLVIATGIGIRILAWLIFELSGQWSAQDVHRASVQALSKVRVTFFDENPSGRLINRLIRDFDNFRLMGVIRIGDVLNALGDIFAAALFVSLSQPLVVILLLPTLTIFAYIQCNIAIMVHRLGFLYAAARGQFLHRETDVLEGLRQYRLFSAETALLKRVKLAAAKFIEINYLRSRVEAWGRFWISVGNSGFIFASLVALSYAVTQGSLSTAAAVVLVTVLLRVTPAFTWLMWVSSYTIESVAVCQRVFGIIDLKSEIQEEGLNLPSQACQIDLLKGDIDFKNFGMSYRLDSPPILSNFSLKLPAGKRIGIIGRTGAGKSSILQSLFRMVYVREGDISIGDQSIYQFSPDFIRAHFAVVPQESYLFKGSLRSNLDPKQEFDDLTMISALKKVDLNFSLDFELQEEGNNVSAGERQLLCLARALLLDRPIFVLDEPTSGLDTITDAAVQRLLESELVGKTVIAIAHRLETLKSYDIVYEVSAGDIKLVPAA